MARKDNRRKGIEGENYAIDFLRKKGFCLLERNFRLRGGEIDLIFLDGPQVVFVEVKSRTSTTFGHPIEAMTPWKRERLWRTAQIYLSQRRWQEKSFRFDLICILNVVRREPKAKEILHIINFLEQPSAR